MENLEGRVALISGAVSGIGLGVARAFARAGIHVALGWRRQDHLAQALGLFAADGLPEPLAVKLDVLRADQWQAAVDATVARFGRLDVLVCSAGITGPNTTLADYDFADWKRVYDVNVHGVFLCNRAAVHQMTKNDYGRIVNIASIAGKDGNPNASAYSSSKAAVIGLTKSLGKELARTGIRVNCVTPAAVRTAIFDQMTQQHIDFMLSKIPMGRFGLPEEVAEMAAFLASDAVSFSTGAVFDCSGGRATY